jgi:hypothetical protein
MTNIVEETIGGFVSGFGAGIIGYTTGIVTQSLFEAFSPFSPLIAILSVFYGIVTFFTGINEAYVAGVFFSIGVVSAGWLLGDAVTIISGLISIAGLVLGVIKSS